jgi:hypothetical protein
MTRTLSSSPTAVTLSSSTSLPSQCVEDPSLYFCAKLNVPWSLSMVPDSMLNSFSAAISAVRGVGCRGERQYGSEARTRRHAATQRGGGAARGGARTTAKLWSIAGALASEPSPLTPPLASMCSMIVSSTSTILPSGARA